MRAGKKAKRPRNNIRVVPGQRRFCRYPPLAFRGMGESRWHPWRALRDQHPDIVVSCQHRLPDRIMGLQRGARIWLCRSLTQVERRCTLSHELLHVERGPLPADPVGAAREERAVDQLAARRLITLPDLVDGLRVHRDDPAQLADHLWVDGSQSWSTPWRTSGCGFPDEI